MNNHEEHIMNVSDEQLSAFLDAELPEAEMEAIRQQLSIDDTLTNRLAELAIVDSLVANSYARIDERPLPKSISNLLAVDEKSSSNVVAFPLWKKLQNRIQQHAAIAASVALILGFGITQMMKNDINSDGSLRDWKNIAQVLETTPSGINRGLVSGIQVKPQLTFKNKAAEFCRQFQVKDNKGTTDNIACRDNANWQLIASMRVDKIQDDNVYQPASGGSVLDSTVEKLASGDFFDAQSESTAITNHWAMEK